MGLGYCSKVVSTGYALQTFHLAGGIKRRHSLPAEAMAKPTAGMSAEGILDRVQQCKFGGHAQHTAAPYGFIDGTGAFPHSGMLFNCVTGEGKGRRVASDHNSWRPIHDGHPEFVVNLSSPLTSR